MAILRAGPWGNLSSPHEDPIVDLNPGFPPYPNITIYPVNCAKGNWPNQDWGAIATTFTDDYYEEYFLRGLNDTVTIYGFNGYINFDFCYQATQEFDIDITWLITATGTYLPDISWNYNTIEGTNDSYFNTPADSGTETVTLPASTLGVFSGGVGIGSDGVETVEVYLS